jgi:chromate transporter
MEMSVRHYTVTAAAVGAIAGAAIILSKQAVMDWPTILIAVVSLFLLIPFKKLPEPLLILGAGIVGITVKIRLVENCFGEAMK